jgi:nitrogen fixation protein FixH
VGTKKMKINWGTGIVLAFIGFMCFILYFVIKVNTDKKYDHDLVNEDYYKLELEFQNDINKELNAKNLLENINIKKTENGLLIAFPEDIMTNSISGKVFLYRPSNKQLDFEVPISLSGHNLLIPDKRLLDGRWNIKVDWQFNGKSYLYKKEIVY